MLLGNPLLTSFYFIFLSSLRKIVREEDSSLALEINVFMMIYFIMEGTFTMEIEGAGRFIICGGGKSSHITCVYLDTEK